MARTALVTGSAGRVAEVGDALEQVGYEVTRIPGPLEGPGAFDGMAPGSINCYVQLPQETTVSGDTLVERVREFLAFGLLSRFEAASAALRLLGTDSTVLLVTGNLPGAATPDDRHARIDLLRVLARAILAECGEGDVRAVVVGNHRSADDIAQIALNRGDEGRRRTAEVAAISPDLPYADWQREMTLITTEE